MNQFEDGREDYVVQYEGIKGGSVGRWEDMLTRILPGQVRGWNKSQTVDDVPEGHAYRVVMSYRDKTTKDGLAVYWNPKPAL